MTLPPGQHAIEGFPRFGTHFRDPPPAVPEAPAIEMPDGTSCAVAGLADMPRTELIADFHCVAGWSATGLRWEGVRLADFLPAVPEGTSHVVFHGLDGFWSFMEIEDALADDVLLADRLNGAPLSASHGAPVRLVCPAHYGFVNAKHLCRIEWRTEEPREGFGTASPYAGAALQGDLLQAPSTRPCLGGGAPPSPARPRDAADRPVVRRPPEVISPSRMRTTLT